MAIKVSGTTVINDSRQIENIDTLKLAGTNIDVANATTSINYINPAQSTGNANGATSGGLYVRSGGIWYYRLNQNANWSGAATLVCSKSDSSSNNVDSTLASIVDGDTLVVWINSSNYGVYEVNDSSIFTSSLAHFIDVDFVSGVGNFAVANNGALQLKVGFTTAGTTLTKTNPTAARTITLPDASGTVALTSDVNPVAAVADGTGGTPTFDKSDGCSSLTDLGTGYYQYNLSSNMSDANYYACGVSSYGGSTYGRYLSGEYTGGNIDYARTTGACAVGNWPENAADGLTGLLIAGDLA